MSWLKKRSTDESIRFIRKVSALCSDLGGPLSDELNKLIQDGKFKEVIDYEIDYNLLYTYSDFKYARQISALVSKQGWINVGYDPEKEAYSKFKEMEEKCYWTNERLSCASPSGDVSVIIHYAKRKIAQILGLVPPYSAFDFSFGPGASTNVKMTEACYRSKLSASLVCSGDMVPSLGGFLEEFPMWVAQHSTKAAFFRSPTEEGLLSTVPVTIHDGKLCFVPKTSKTHRPIVVEPLLNGIAQKGIGGYMKRRLMKFGCDLSDQSRNRNLALKGSLSNKLATIDLSSASDCISCSVVWELLPFGWADLLSSFRTGTVTYRGEVIHLEKFSSMGNGYTFELESLIFFSLASAVAQHLSLDHSEVSVYGDDIIIPTEGYSLLKTVLDFLGFIVNPSKSFINGPFRESCGADWLNGMDIRPFYLREEVSDRVLYLFHNWAMRNCERELAELIHSETDPAYRIYGPDGYGDGHLLGSHRLRLSRKLRRAGWGGGFFDTYSLGKRSFKRLLPGDWLVPTYSVYTRAGERDPSDPNIVRGSRGYAKISIYTLATSIFRRV
jgi:hypothetical protein